MFRSVQGRIQTCGYGPSIQKWGTGWRCRSWKWFTQRRHISTKCVSKTHGYESTLKGVDASLERFRSKYIDLWLIHDPFSGKEKRLETYRALQEAKQDGKIRDVGVSNYGVHHLEELEAAGYQMPAVNQIELHPFCQQKPIVEYCRSHSIVVQAYSPLRRGKLDDPTLIRIAERINRTPAQIMIRWSLQKGFVPLPKSENTERIFSNTDVFDWSLSGQYMEELDGLDRGKDGAVTWNPVNALWTWQVVIFVEDNKHQLYVHPIFCWNMLRSVPGIHILIPWTLIFRLYDFTTLRPVLDDSSRTRNLSSVCSVIYHWPRYSNLLSWQAFIRLAILFPFRNPYSWSCYIPFPEIFPIRSSVLSL